MRIMMVFPSGYLGWDSSGKGFEQSAQNIGLASLSATLKNAGHECFLVDLRKFSNWEQFTSCIKTEAYDAAFVSFFSVDEQYADRAIHIIKSERPGIPVVVGGCHVTYSDINTFSEADIIVKGEGEDTVLDVLCKMQEGYKGTIIGNPIADIDALSNIDRTLFDQKKENAFPILPLLPSPFYTFLFSRGCCYGRCAFCLQSLNRMWKKYRMRSPERCIDEIIAIEKLNGPIGSIMIHDDCAPLFVPSWGKRFIELWDHHIGRRIPFWVATRADYIIRCRELMPDLVRIGMTWCSLGIESGSQRMLDFLQKGITVEDNINAAQILHDNGVNIFCNMIFGLPTETDDDVAKSGQLLKTIRPEWQSNSIWTSYPGSALYYFCRDNNLWFEPMDDPQNHYSLTRFPYERKIKGIDYERLFKTLGEFAAYKGEYREFTKTRN